MQVTAANFKTATASPSRKIKNYLLVASGALQAMGGALMVAAPHLQTVLTAQGFAYTMIGTGVVTAGLAFISTALKTGDDE